MLGSTGSIGTQTLDVCARHPDRYRVVALAARSSAAELRAQAERFHPELVALTDEGARYDGASVPSASTHTPASPPLPNAPRIAIGPDALLRAVETDCDAVVVAISGMTALRAVLRAIELRRDVYLATKEVLAAGGSLVLSALHAVGGGILGPLAPGAPRLIPVDSEHAAIYQCLDGAHTPPERIALTASGGPFRLWSREAIAAATPEQALAHPTWRMGPQITIGSATLANKGLEVIEAHHLFGLPADRIDVVVHPQSVIHSAVTFVDGASLAQLGAPDMRTAIGYALAYPERFATGAPALDFAALPALTFEPPDLERFPCLALAYDALRLGGVAPCVYNAANETAVTLFLNRSISFVQMPLLIERALATIRGDAYTLAGIERADGEARALVTRSAMAL